MRGALCSARENHRQPRLAPVFETGQAECGETCLIRLICLCETGLAAHIRDFWLNRPSAGGANPLRVSPVRRRSHDDHSGDVWASAGATPIGPGSASTPEARMHPRPWCGRNQKHSGGAKGGDKFFALPWDCGSVASFSLHRCPDLIRDPAASQSAQVLERETRGSRPRATKERVMFGTGAHGAPLSPGQRAEGVTQYREQGPGGKRRRRTGAATAGGAAITRRRGKIRSTRAPSG